jgi:hypothetical protein
MTTTTPTMESLGELLHHYYGETLAAEGDRDPAAVARLIGDLLDELHGLGQALALSVLPPEVA